MGGAGLIAIKYIGYMEMDNYQGEVTKGNYSFGLLRMKGYVDSRDLFGLLNLEEDGKLIFEVIE